MTDEEKRKQKAMLLLEYQEAEEALAHLREKAVRIKKPFEDVAIWLNAASLGHYQIEDLRINGTIRSNLEAYQNALKFDEALALKDEITKAEKLLEDLAARKLSLGVK
jgi:hypothetical protein